MDYGTFLHRVIDDGIAAAATDYATVPHKSQGAVAGFQACRGKDPTDLCNVVSAVLTCSTRGQAGIAIVPPTARGVFKAAEILGVSGERPRQEG